MTAAAQSPFAMTLSLNVLNHLGINLYSNVSAVLSEVVANAYDADAETVRIVVDQVNKQITITDDGIGMTEDDVNERFLTVGYRRRDNNNAVTKRFERPVMGRKGIGKLSLFSIARQIDVYTTKDGQKSAFRMLLSDIEKQIKDSEAGHYRPAVLDNFPVDLPKGTRIVLSDLKKEMRNVVGGLTKRLARRFSILGSEYHFQVFIDAHEVTPLDRNYFHKAQFIWTFESEERSSEVFRLCRNSEHSATAPPVNLPEGSASGWLATSFSPKDLIDDDGEKINRVTLIVRGKLAHENLLEEIKESSIFGAYLFGEIHADFLDNDESDDIATSSRQKIVEDDPRYQSLINWFTGEVRKVGAKWTELRNSQGTSAALENQHINDWFQTLEGNTKSKAERLFGRINQLTIDNKEQRAQLFAHSVLAFEVLRYKDNLDAIESMETADLQAIGVLFSSIEDLEAVLYHRIVTQRLKVIEKLQEHVDNNALERILHEHLFTNLWLLDPSWERATEKLSEITLGKAFIDIVDDLSEEEKASRVDIKYKRVAGSHVIVELKRHSVKTTTLKLYEQIDKYRTALVAQLSKQGKGDESVECVCVLGEDPADWKRINGRQISEDTLKPINARIVMYEELLINAYESYKSYLDTEEKTSTLRKVLASLTEDVEQDVS
ncbi:ATP-binding protein [Amycolatopsis sp. NPDC048633]|uniref:BbrUII/HgiDII family restriction enzyme n=1 Tax=Amycolatopsis sp. NPDC048633 TaxID=3157095 RepID=UPI0033F8C7D2